MRRNTTPYNTIKNTPLIITEVTTLVELNKIFCIENRDGTHIDLNNIEIINNEVYFKQNGQIKSVCSLIMEVKHLQTARWLNHIYF